MKDKWQTLEHNGPLFPADYEYIGFDPKLSPLAEEMLYHYSAKLETEYVHNATFNSNFFNALYRELPSEYKNRKLEDFLPLCKVIFAHIQKKKEDKKNRSKEEREQEVKNKELIKEKYGYCILNGEKQPIASPMIEGPGIFIARGAHPQLGAWKYRVKPEDVTLNSTNKIDPPAGYKWKRCEENKGSMEPCKYDVHLSTGTVLVKRILFAPTSCVKQSSDQKKFEKAIKLLAKWKEVELLIKNGLQSKDEDTRQTALVTYLIMNLGIRVGDEKDEDQADTVGASTLRRDHVHLQGKEVALDFLGKDSVRYINSLNLSDEAADVLSKILSSRSTNEKLFPNVTSPKVTEFLSSTIDGVTAKVFRTAWASSLLAKELRAATLLPSYTETEKVAIFNEANLVVAKKLNHQKNVSKTYDSSSSKLDEKLTVLTAQLEEEERVSFQEISKIKYQIKTISSSLSEKDRGDLLAIYNSKIDKLVGKVARKKQQLNDFCIKKELKDKTKSIALGTSKASYCDPRIGISWCKGVEVSADRLYSKTMQDKFSWALDCQQDFYKNYPSI